MRTTAFLFLLCPFLIHAQSEDEEISYGQHQIAISPLQFYGSDELSDTGLGLSYEYFLKDKVALHVPLAFGLNQEVIQAGLGLRLYPTGHERPVSYSIEPLFLYSQGQDEYFRFDYSEPLYSTVEEVEVNIRQLGFLLMHSVNVNIDGNIHVGLSAGFGVNYFTSADIEDHWANLDDEPRVNGLVRVNLGYRF